MCHLKLLQEVVRITLVAIMLAGCITPIATPVSDAPAATSTAEPATPTSAPSPTATPTEVSLGVGVPAVGGDWEITIIGIGQETVLISAFLEYVDPKSGHTFLIVQAAVRNLTSSASTPLPKGDALFRGVNLYETASAPATAFSLRDLSLVNQDGTAYSLFGFGVGDRSDFVIAPNLLDFKVASPDENAVYNFAFEIPENSIGQPFHLEYQQIPPIPFTASPG